MTDHTPAVGSVFCRVGNYGNAPFPPSPPPTPPSPPPQPSPPSPAPSCPTGWAPCGTICIPFSASCCDVTGATFCLHGTACDSTTYGACVSYSSPPPPPSPRTISVGPVLIPKPQPPAVISQCNGPHSFGVNGLSLACGAGCIPQVHTCCSSTAACSANMPVCADAGAGTAASYSCCDGSGVLGCGWPSYDPVTLYLNPVPSTSSSPPPAAASPTGLNLSGLLSLDGLDAASLLADAQQVAALKMSVVVALRSALRLNMQSQVRVRV